MRTLAVALGGLWALVAVAAAPAHADAELVLDQQWLQDVSAEQAWETTRGAGVSVALLSTTVDTEHPDLASGDAPAVERGPDFVDSGAEQAEAGTRLAGILAARGHGREHDGGARGMAPEATVLSLRVSSDVADGTVRAESVPVAEALRHAARQGVQVALLPTLIEEPEQQLRSALDYARESGVLIVTPDSAVALDGAVRVAAAGMGAPESRPAPTLSAPGADVLTTQAGGDYTAASGSEAAAAVVAGTAALIRSAYPHLHPDQVTESLLAGALPADGAAADAQGAGVIDAGEAMSAAALVAEDVPTIDESLVTQDAEATPWPWLLGIGIPVAVLVAGGLAVAVRLVRRRTRDPYGVDAEGSDAEANDPAPEAAVTGAAARGRRGGTRRGRRGTGRGARRS